MHLSAVGGTGGGGSTPHNLLDGSIDQDTVAKSVLAGMMIFGNATPKWDGLAIGATGLALVVAAGLPAWAVLGVAGGGTSYATYTSGDTLYASGASALSKLAIGSAGQVLTVVSGVPAWATAGSGTVTSITVTVPSFLSVSPATITTSGTFAITLATEAANVVFCGPASGAVAAPTFRALVGLDLPAAGTISTLTNGATVAVDASLVKIGGTYRLTTTQNFTLSSPTNLTDGQVFTIEITSAAVRTITWGGAYDGTYVSLPSATSGGGATDILVFRDVGGVVYLVAATQAVLGTAHGGTGTALGLLGTGSILYANSTTTFTTLATSTDGKYLKTASGIPAWSTIDAGDIGSGTLPVTRGGVGVTSYTTGDILYATASTTLSKLAIGSTGQVLTVAAGLPSWATPGSGGTVTSVAMTVPAEMSVAGTPITTSGTLAVTWATEAANVVFAGPTSGGAATPAFRALVAADIPNLDASKITAGTLAVARGGTNLGSYTSGDLLYASGSTTLSKLAIGSAGQALVVSSSLPAWGTLGVAGGGTGITSYTANDLLYATASTTLSKLAIGSNGQVLAVVSGAPAWHFLSEVVALTDGANIAIDSSLFPSGNTTGRVTLGGNRTLSNPTNVLDGRILNLEIIQDGTGSRTLAYDTKYAFTADVASPTLSTGANKHDFIGFKYNSTADKWYAQYVNKGG